MIYRAPERSTPVRGRTVTHELATLLVGMALLAALILQFACAGAGAGGSAGRWLCVNNARLAALRPATPTPTHTPPPGRAAGIRPIAQPSAGAPIDPTEYAIPTSPSFENDAFAPVPTDDGGASTGYPGAGSDAARVMPVPGTPMPNVFDDRRATRTALAAEGLAAATARALAIQAVGSATPTATSNTALGTATQTPTPGPGTPSVTPGASPTGTAAPTETGYP